MFLGFLHIIAKIGMIFEHALLINQHMKTAFQLNFSTLQLMLANLPCLTAW